MLRIAVVGAGGVMQMIHLPSLRALAGVEVVALADLNRALGERVARAFGIPRVYGDVAELLEGEAGALDGVVVVCGKQWHASACLPCLRAGLPVFTEKPLAASLTEGQAMVEAAERSGARLMVGYMKRFDPAVLQAERLIREGAIGEVRYARIHDFGGDYVCGRATVGAVPLVPPAPPAAPAPPPSGPPRAAAGPPPVTAAPSPESEWQRAFDEWIEVWVHDVNLVQGMFGGIQRVRWSDGVRPQTARVRCGNGAEVLFEVGGPQPGGMPWDEGLEVFGTRGRLRLSFKPPFLLHARTRLCLERPGGVEEPQCGHAEAFFEEMRYFCRCLESGEVPRTDGRMGLADLEACAAIVDAARGDAAHGDAAPR